MRAPIAIFAYRRPAHLKAMLEALSLCNGIANSPVVIFSDGPKGEQDSPDVLAVREIVSGLGWSNLELFFAKENKGLKRSISEGVTAVVGRYGRAIVLEDDLHLSPIALDYFNAALDKYADDSRVWSICGYMYDVTQLRDRDSAFFLPFTSSWGWATWERAWSQFNPDEELPEGTLKSPSFRRAFSLNGLSDFANMLEMARDGYVSSWFIRWYFKIFSEGGVSLFPPISLIRNRGVSGGAGTHAGKLNPYDLLVRPKPPARSVVRLPDTVSIDFEAMDAIPRSWEASVLRFNHAAGTVKRRVRQRLGF